MEEILASIRRIISDEETPAADAATEVEAEDDMAAAMDGGEEMSQDDLDKLFDSDGDMDVAVAEPEPEPTPEPEPEPEVDAEAEADDVLELTEDLALEEPADDIELVDAAPEPEPAPVEPPKAARKPDPEPIGETLLSSTTDEAVQSAFNNLAGTILSNNARTLEDLVKEMLRPMLKTWLDENLPPMVERLVRQEIERVSRGR
ncbi:DUF2497 domain-containing protein [Stappia sp.]|uniref:PopZ family protein n=1 Tax=Stappia sp. TaxID=1870903 RepID=UPI0032D8BD13